METISRASVVRKSSLIRQDESQSKRRKAIGFIFLCCMLLSFNSCKKDVETFKMIGTWEVESYSEHGADKTTYFKETFVNYGVKFDKSKTFVETATVAGIDINKKGKWKVLPGEVNLELTYASDGFVTVHELVDIKTNSSIIKELETGKQFHLNKM